MLFDSITIADGGDIANLAVASGTAFPNAQVGELFYRTDLGAMHVFNGASWDILAAGSSGIAAALGYTPYSAANPAGYTTNLGTVTEVSGTAPVVSSGGTTPAISMPAATSSVSGYLSSTDWTTFNGKQNALGFTPYNSTNPAGYLTTIAGGGTLTGALVLASDPVVALGAVTKQYVDNIAAGLNAHNAVESASTAALPTCTYSNGTAGIGATLTATANGALTVGGYSLWDSNRRALIKDQADPKQNGVYYVTDAGSPSTPWVMTRAADFDNSPVGEVQAGAFAYVQEGTLAGTQWVVTTIDIITIGTSNIVFGQLAGASTISGGTGISVTGNTVTNTGVTSLVAGTNIALSGSTGAVTVNVSGTVALATKTANIAGGLVGHIPYQSGVDTTALLAPGTTGYVLTSNGTASAPSWQAASGSVTPGTGNVGYLNMPQNATTSATLALTDSGKHIFNTTASQVYTIPANASVAFPIGTAVTFVNQGAGTCTIAITSDTMYLASAGTTGTRTLGTYGVATAIKITATSWIISGAALT